MIGEPDDFIRAHVALNAAAPDMLVALLVAERALAANSHPACAEDPDGPLCIVRAAIAKAQEAA